MYKCPSCMFESVTGGICPCSKLKTHNIYMVEMEDKEEMAQTIKAIGNHLRYAGQKTAKLIYVEVKLVQDLPAMVKHWLKNDIPKTSCAYCIYVGEFGIPFVNIEKANNKKFADVNKSIGKVYTIDYDQDVSCATKKEPEQVKIFEEYRVEPAKEHPDTIGKFEAKYYEPMAKMALENSKESLKEVVSNRLENDFNTLG